MRLAEDRGGGRRRGAADGDGAEDAGALQGVQQGEVQVGVWDGGQAEARFGGVLDV